MNKNFCVIDIGTNTVKCKSFINGKYYTYHNKFFKKQKSACLDIDEVNKYVSEFISEADKNNIPRNRIYIAATEGLRRSPNADEIIARIKKETGRQVHVISPEREALLAVIGGLRPLKFNKPYPKQILFIESGGGSTEVSLVNTSKRPPVINATTSIPLGTQNILIDGEISKTEQLITDKILELVSQIKSKGITIDPSLEVVINSTTAAKIIGKPHNQLNPKTVMQQNLQMKLEDFFAALGESCEKDIEKEYNVYIEKVSGFKSHCYILGSSLMKLKDFLNSNNPNIRTTIEGLKDGLAAEIRQDIEANKSDEEIENNILNIKDRNKKSANNNEDKDKDKDNKDNKDKKNTNNLINKITYKKWTADCEQFYNSRKKSYISKQDASNLISIKDNNNELTYLNPKEVIVSIDKQSTNNHLYEDMIVKAKKDGISSIRFKPNTSLETKLRIYAACKKYNMPTLNFIYNPEMLKTVSPQTKQIVIFATTQSNPKNRERE